MKRKEVFNRAMAAVISISVAAGSFSPVYAAETAVSDADIEKTSEMTVDGQNQKIAKDENVYVTLQGDGSVDGIYVINEYVLEEAAELVDYGDYAEVKNLSSEDEITLDQGCVRVTAPAGRFYYQGMLQDTQLPWNISIAYYLDGEKLSAEELAGKSGSLKLVLEIRENEAAEDLFFENYLVQATVTLNTEKCSNIKADGSTEANIGKNRQLLYNIMAGQEKTFTITADVEDFEMDAMTFQAVPMSFDIDSDSFDKDALYEKTDEIKDAAADFDEGADELIDGVEELADGVSELNDGAGELKDGAGELKDGSSTLLSGTEELADGAETLKSGIKELKTGASKVNSGADSLNQGASDLKKGAKKLADGAETAKTGSEALSENLNTLSGKFTSMQEGTGKIKSGLEELVKNTPALTGGSETVLKSLKKIQSSLSSIDLGMEELQKMLEASKQSLAAITAAKEGTEKIAAGVKALENSFNSAEHDSVAEVKRQNTSAAAQVSALVAEAQQIYAQYGSMIDMALPGKNVPELLSQAADIAGLLKTNNAAFDQIESGISSIAGSLDELSEQLGTFEEKYTAFDEQVQKIPTMLTNMVVEKMQPLKEGIDELVAEYEKLDAGIGTYTGSVAELKEGYDLLYDGLQQAAEGTGQLVKGAQALASGNSELSKGAAELYSGTKTLKSGAKDLKEGTGTLSSGVSEAYSGSKTLQSGGKELKNGASELYDGTVELYDGTVELYDGVAELQEGVAELQDGAAELKDGTTEFVDKTSDINEQIDEEIDKVLDDIAGTDFVPISFTSKKNTSIGLVQFAMQTGAIKKEEEPVQAETEEETESFSEKLRDLFR